jgi:hypothetical protein
LNSLNKRPTSRLTKSEKEDLFPTHLALTNAKILLSDGYVNFSFTGDCVGLQLKLKGNALVECTLGREYTYAYKNGTLLIYSLTNLPLPKDILRFYGKLSITDCLGCDVFGNGRTMHTKKDFVYSETPLRMNDTISNMNTKRIGNMKNVNSMSYEFKNGVKLVPRGTFKSFLNTMDSKVSQLVESNKNEHKKHKEKIVPIDNLIITKVQKRN